MENIFGDYNLLSDTLRNEKKGEPRHPRKPHTIRHTPSRHEKIIRGMANFEFHVHWDFIFNECTFYNLI
jgi:hypothetical protein